MRNTKKMGESACFVSVVPNAEKAVKSTASRLGRKGLYMPLSFSYDEIKAQNRKLVQLLCGIDRNDGAIAKFEEYENRRIKDCEEVYERLKDLIGDAPVVIDHTAHPRPLGMAKFLLMHGFNVQEIYVNAINPEEKECEAWFRDNAPHIRFEMPIEPSMRVKERVYRDNTGKHEKVLAIGGQAAWFTGTNYFVNMVEGGDLQGIDGIARFAELMEDAWLHEKDASNLVPRKGLGCPSCI